MTTASDKRNKRDALRTGGPGKISRNGPERPSAEDDKIDAAIKRSIDDFGA
jgi:hypothetical protein